VDRVVHCVADQARGYFPFLAVLSPSSRHGREHNGSNLSLTMTASNGTLILSGSDTYTGGTIVTAGTLDVTSRYNTSY